MLLTFLFVLLLHGLAVTQDLPPEILADQYLLEARKALEKGDAEGAFQALGKIQALDTDPPPEFAFFLGKALMEYGTAPSHLTRGQELLKEFVISAGRDSAHYTAALELLSEAGAKMEEMEAKAEAALAQILPELLTEIDSQMVRVPDGTIFKSSELRPCEPGDVDVGIVGRDDEPLCPNIVKVEVRTFEISKYEVTQELYEAVMGGNPSRFQPCPRCPVESVNWDDVQTFLRLLNAGDGRYRLPTGDEMEYIIRRQGYKWGDGGKNRCRGIDNPDAVAWHEGNSNNKTHPVGQKQANDLGLYDVFGNVSEWGSDCDGEPISCAEAYTSSFYTASEEICAYRVGIDFEKRYRNVGFRLARSLP